jgi:hypothetical protein
LREFLHLLRQMAAAPGDTLAQYLSLSELQQLCGVQLGEVEATATTWVLQQVKDRQSRQHTMAVLVQLIMSDWCAPLEQACWHVL